MKHHYLILGAGMQGTAAAYDLARFADAQSITLADMDPRRARIACDRVNRLVGAKYCKPAEVDVLSASSLEECLNGADMVLSCVPYWMHPQIADSAIKTGTNMCDLGGNTQITWQTLEKCEAAKEAGISVVPDCGLAPGLVNSLGMYLIETMAACDSVRLYCGVLPQHPIPPFNYKLTFNVEGLVTEYDYKAIALRDGEIVEIDTLSELEEIEIDQLGKMEAFTTSGGTSTAAYTFQGRLMDYEYKTIRFPGHCERMRIFKDFGFWNEKPVDIKGSMVRPKDLFCKIFGEKLGRIEDTDQCAIRAIGSGTNNGLRTTTQIDLFDEQCEDTEFTSMERLTGFSLSIIAQHVLEGGTPKGCVRYEEAMPGVRFVEELGRRGIEIKIQEY